MILDLTFKKIFNVYLFLAGLGLRFCVWTFLSCSMWASHCSDFSCCRAWALGCMDLVL